MNISEQLSITAQEYADKPAYIFEHNITSYQELNQVVTLFASGLASLGYKKGDHIALVVGNSPYYIIGLYGALRLGLVVIPINPLYTPTEMNYILYNGDVQAVITLDRMLEKFQAMDRELDISHYIVCDSGAEEQTVSISQQKIHAFSEVFQLGKPHFSGPELHKHDPAIVLYTSGTTGAPKGAVLSHHNIYSNAKDVADYLSINDEDKVIAALPMFHVFCLTVSVNAPLMNGGTILILPKFSPTAVFALSKTYEATIFAGVPTMYNYLLQAKSSNQENPFSTIRFCISGGASMPVALLKGFEQAFDVKISEGYGLSEASPVTCFNPLDKPRKPGSIGRSIQGVENKVVDEWGEEVATGEVGELIVRGPNVMLGYYKLPEETKAVLKDGWLYTGDMARMDEEGYFYIVDRKKDMILVGGYNVYPREVEEVLYRHPNVVEVAVLGSPNPETGEAVQCFVVTDSPLLTKEDLTAFCQIHLTKYKIPENIIFLDELPKNTTGKILRKNLREQVLQ
ncbi:MULTISPECIES: fatty acid--CoA ligase family protein [Clostridia]|uniref:fatty acid--CoA ligase family protein n=1 Tax=Clostridia TaxID=186801 RepID=UPI000EA000E9|nr:MULTISPECIES: fatty acid--CoA ligase family protein [Clostridia]NBJ69174.1 fatty acid--CoA ligase family protein [Roseburia sp. 1XD42-34]RKI79593.1 fatty acid--CoA ligase family protein [Clostridium sp. 1xD42-85]